MLSPNGFVNGASTDPITHNSCPTGWNDATSGNIPCWAGAATGCAAITCAGTKDLTQSTGYGTGPFKFKSRTQSVQTAATCTETASTSVSTDATNCAAITGTALTDASACEAVALAAGSGQACTYTGDDMQVRMYLTQ